MIIDENDDGVDRRRLLGAGLGAVGGVAALSALAQPAAAAASEAQFFTLVPNRVVDSRSGRGTAVGKIRGNQTRTVSLSGLFNSGYSLTAALNVTVTSTENAGYLTLWESGLTRPGTSTINWWGPGQTYGNFTVVGLRSSTVTFDLFCGGSTAATHVLIDLLGYFYTDGTTRVRPPAERRQ